MTAKNNEQIKPLDLLAELATDRGRVIVDGSFQGLGAVSIEYQGTWITVTAPTLAEAIERAYDYHLRHDTNN